MAETYLFRCVGLADRRARHRRRPERRDAPSVVRRRDQRWRKDFARRHPDAALVEERDPFGHASALRGYFAGDMDVLDRIPVVFGGTQFQNKVWKQLRRIPVGQDDELWCAGKEDRQAESDARSGISRTAPTRLP